VVALIDARNCTRRHQQLCDCRSGREELRIEAKLALGTAAESNDDAYAPTSGKPNVRRHKNRKQTTTAAAVGRHAPNV
jgi:hypothetical protein